MNNIYERIKYAYKKSGLKHQKDFASALGISPAYASMLLKGTATSEVSDALLTLIGFRCGVNINWLKSGEGDPDDAQFMIISDETARNLPPSLNSKPLQRGMISLGVPLIDHWSGGYPEVAREGAGEFAPMEPLDGGLAFVLRESGMHPKLQPGDYISFVPGSSYGIGDLVVVSDEFGDLMVRYYREKEGQIYIVAETTAYPIIEATDLKYRILGKLHEAVRKLKL